MSVWAAPGFSGAVLSRSGTFSAMEGVRGSRLFCGLSLAFMVFFCGRYGCR